MSTPEAMKHGTLTLTREIEAPRALVFEAWTQLGHRRHWFKGPDWTEIERTQDLRVGGLELAHGRFASGVETMYVARYHLIEPDLRLVYAFDMHVAGRHFSISLTGVDFRDAPAGTSLTYTEQGFFLAEGYDEESRLAGTNLLLDRFTDYISGLA